MIEALSIMLTLGYLVAAACFLRAWQKTAERLFLALASAFMLFALNDIIRPAIATFVLEPGGFIYALRILGFVVIVGALVDRNHTLSKRSDARNSPNRAL
jgi:Na+-translocating ferredoxin:NAD+ oxidoreductase RnfA subunit